jgi:isopenicillin-N N-acyltransferase-like protein
MFPIVDVSGDAFERGRRHGASAKPRVQRSLANYARLFSYYGVTWDEAQRRAAAYRDVIGNFDARLLEEIDGIASGAGRDASEILALNVRTEILPLDRPTGPVESMDTGECTAIAVPRSASTTGETLLAQNWDWVEAQREALILLRVREARGAAYVTLTEAGMLAKIGFNAHGLGMCLNILRSVFDGREAGIPVHIALRAFLECRDVADAILLAQTLVFAGSSNVLMADRSGDCASLELSPRGVRVVRSESGPLCHTNHFLHAEAAAWDAKLAANFSSEPRLARARTIAAAKTKQGIEDLKRLLSDETEGPVSICRKPDRSLPAEAQTHTVASIVMELGRGVMHVAPGEPAHTAYEPVALGEAIAA